MEKKKPTTKKTTVKKKEVREDSEIKIILQREERGANMKYKAKNLRGTETVAILTKVLMIAIKEHAEDNGERLFLYTRILQEIQGEVRGL